ncbi:hypothetical protein M2305_002678 [Gluconobacter cerinus]|uniref:hypothetical protein n=1 Tax=Gluconobacter cerinus TaxID=38307 RepID=UPI00222647A6|nr:hypothetical protein [Gluconobacter cerinus]MCW2266731.1 hypothetical protein [Gluconobacter cerinus]
MRGLDAIIGKGYRRGALTDVVEFPRYDVGLSAGHGAAANYKVKILPSFLALSRFLLPTEILAVAPHLIAIDVSGDCMTPV